MNAFFKDWLWKMLGNLKILARRSFYSKILNFWIVISYTYTVYGSWMQFRCVSVGVSWLIGWLASSSPRNILLAIFRVMIATQSRVISSFFSCCHTNGIIFPVTVISLSSHTRRAVGISSNLGSNYEIIKKMK